MGEVMMTSFFFRGSADNPEAAARLLVGCLPVCTGAAPATAALAQACTLDSAVQTTCCDASNIAAICRAVTASPNQDSSCGRDATVATGTVTKTGDGRADFDFSCALWNGAVGSLANAAGIASATTATDWASTRDIASGHVWCLVTLSSISSGNSTRSAVGSPVGDSKAASSIDATDGFGGLPAAINFRAREDARSLPTTPK